MPISLTEADLAIEYPSKGTPRALPLLKINLEHSPPPPIIDERFCIKPRLSDQYAKAKVSYHGQQQPMNQFTDPNNTTVFVGGLSGCDDVDRVRPLSYPQANIKKIREVTPPAPNLEGGTMSTFQSKPYLTRTDLPEASAKKGLKSLYRCYPFR